MAAQRCRISGAILCASSGAISLAMRQCLGSNGTTWLARRLYATAVDAEQGLSGFNVSRLRRLRQFQRPAHDVVFEILVGHVLLSRADPAAHRDAGRMHGLGIARDQRMPPIKVPALGQEHIGAGRRQPGDVFQILRREPHAIVDLFEAVRVVAAAAASGRPAAGSRPRCNKVRSRALLLKLVEAALAAAVTKALPFRIRHFLTMTCAARTERRRAPSCHGVAMVFSKPGILRPNLPPIAIHPVALGALAPSYMFH